MADENEEFEFRLRAEKEAGAAPKPSAPTYGQKVEEAGKAVDKAAGPGLKGASKAAFGAAEDVLSMFSGVAGDVAGAATSIATQDPKRGETVKQSMTYQPRTETGKAGMGYVGAIAEPLTRILGLPAETLKEHGYPIMAQGAQAVMDVAPIKVPEAIKGAREVVKPVAEQVARKGEEAAAIKTAERAPQQAKIEQAKARGIAVPPSEGGGAVGRALEGVSGKVQTEMAFSRKNAAAINKTVAQEIGLSDRQPMTEANIDRLKKKEFAVYDRVKNAGRINMGPEFKQELESVKERTAQAQADFPEDTNELIDKEIKKFDRPSADAGSMLEKIKSLRAKASKNMQAPDAEKFELGLAQKKIATALENQIERQLSDYTSRHIQGYDPQLIEDFRKSRVNLAKIYNVEDALGPNGNVSAAVLARQLKRGVPLSGGLKDIAELYQEFPKVMRYVDNLGGHAPFSALDYLVGGVEGIANPGKAAAIAGALAGRPVARGIIGSRAYQKSGIKAQPVKPSVVSRAARKIAGPSTLGDLEETTPKKPATVSDSE